MDDLHHFPFIDVGYATEASQLRISEMRVTRVINLHPKTRYNIMEQSMIDLFR